MPTAKVSKTRKAVARKGQRKGVSVEEHRRGQPELLTRITISSLPDNVLLEIFDLYLDAARRVLPKVFPTARGGRPESWLTLVHVCRRWRCVVSASPRRLELVLVCTVRRPVKRNIWPELPIAISSKMPKSRRSRSQGMNIIIAALKQQHNRVCQISISDVPNSLLKKFAAINTPFPALTFLNLTTLEADEGAPVLPESFLGGSAPRLRWLMFQGVPFPALGKLLLSSCDISELFLDNIPHSGYISPDALVSSLSGLTRLRYLTLKFQSPRSRAARESRVPPSLTRVVLPALVYWNFKGDSEYLEDMLSRMDAPVHAYIMITFFNQLVFDTPFLRNLVERAVMSKAFPKAEITFSSYGVFFTLFQKHGPVEPESRALEFGISCRPLDWQLSSIAQVIGSAIPPLPTLERLKFGMYQLQLWQDHWQDDMENAQWLELLRLFAPVKDLVLCGQFLRLVAPALGELNGERVTEELPALQNILFEDFFGALRWQEVIGPFITARQIAGRPVHLGKYYW